MARWDTIQVDGQPMRAYLDVPAGGPAAPGIVVIQHGPGLDRFIEDRVEDLARHGYTAAAPDLYHRQPPDGADMMTRISRLRDAEILADVDATIGHLRGLRDQRAADLAVLGFCMGGRVTYLLAGARPAAWRAAGVFYGGNIMKPWGEGPRALRPHAGDRLPRHRLLRPRGYEPVARRRRPDRCRAHATRQGPRVPSLRGRRPRVPELHQSRAPPPGAGGRRLGEDAGLPGAAREGRRGSLARPDLASTDRGSRSS